MTKTTLIKNLLSDTLKQLSKQKRLDKITIVDIISAAGISRPAFYYHFRDKQELISWTFRTDLEKIVTGISKSCAIRDRGYSKERICQGKPFYITPKTENKENYMTSYWVKLYNYLHDNKSFYTVAFDYSFPGNLQEHLFSLHYNLYREEIQSKVTKSISQENINFIAQYLACSSTGSTILWIRQGMPTTDGISRQFYDLTHRCLDLICNNYFSI